MTSVQAHAHTSSTIVPGHPLALFPPRPFKSALPPPRSVSPSPAPSLHSARYPPFQPVTPFLSLAYMRHAADSGRRPTASPKPTPPPLRCGGGLRAARLPRRRRTDARASPRRGAAPRPAALRRARQRILRFDQRHDQRPSATLTSYSEERLSLVVDGHACTGNGTTKPS